MSDLNENNQRLIDAEWQKFQLEKFREYAAGGFEMIAGARDATMFIYMGVGLIIAILSVYLMRRGLRRAFKYEVTHLSKYSKIEDGFVMIASLIVTVICVLAIIGFTQIKGN